MLADAVYGYRKDKKPNYGCDERDFLECAGLRSTDRHHERERMITNKVMSKAMRSSRTSALLALVMFDTIRSAQ